MSTDADLPQEETVLYDAFPSMWRSQPVGFVLAWILVIAFGIGLLILIPWYIRSRSTRLTVTPDQISLRTGWLSKNTNDVFIENVRNIQVKQSFLQRMFDTGYIGISSAGQAGIEIEVTGLPDPDGLKRIIDAQRTKLRKD